MYLLISNHCCCCYMCLGRCPTINRLQKMSFHVCIFPCSYNGQFKIHRSCVFGGRKGTCCFVAGKMVQIKNISIPQGVCNPKARVGMMWNTAEQYPHNTCRWSGIWLPQLECFVKDPQTIAGLWTLPQFKVEHTIYYQQTLKSQVRCLK